VQRCEHRLQCRAENNNKSWIAVPIRHGQEVLGTLSFVCTTTDREMLETDLRFLALIAGQVGLAVRFRQLAKERFDSLQKENDRLQEQIKKALCLTA
jgi:Nif-specific regulatory protein